MDYTPLQADTEYIAHCDGAKQQCNKSNLRDLIAATGLVILLKLNSNRQFFSPCEIEIWWMTSKNYRAPLLHYIKFCASSQTPRWIKTGVTVRKPSIRVKIGDFFVPCDLENWWMTLKSIGHLFYGPLSCFGHHFKAISEFKLELQSGNAQFGSKSVIFCLVWPWNLMDDLEKQ